MFFAQQADSTERWRLLARRVGIAANPQVGGAVHGCPASEAWARLLPLILLVAGTVGQPSGSQPAGLVLRSR